MLIEKLDKFWSPSISPFAAQIFSRGFALLALLHLFFSFPGTLSDYFGPKGLFSPETLVFHPIDWSLFPLLGSEQILFFYGFVIFCLLSILVGRLIKPALFITFLWHLSVVRLFVLTSWHIDALFCVTNLYLLLIPYKKTDCPAPGLRFMQIQLSLIYLISGLSKLKQDQWLSGQAIEYFFDSWIASIPLAVPELLSLSLGYGVIGLELFFAVAIFIPQWRKTCFLLAVLFHGSLFFLSHIKIFSLLMIFAHLCYRSDWIEGWRLRLEPLKQLPIVAWIPSFKRS